MSEENAVPSAANETVYLGVIRQPLELLIIYCVAYTVVFILGLVGNIFVLISVAKNQTMRTITNYFISSLAIADLLVIVFCLPATLFNNVLTEWLLGDFLCKFFVWLSGTTVCASVYTLVAVSADRYTALCHSITYSTWAKGKSLYFIIPIWIFAGALFTPWFSFFQETHFPLEPNTFLDGKNYARICVPVFPTPDGERLFFLIANFLIAFLIPLMAITVFYSYIFASIFRRKTLAVDRQAHVRETRTRLRVTRMMVTVVIMFAASWLPVYCLFTYFYFSPEFRSNQEGPEVPILQNILRPIFQWLSLANSCCNPILYCYFSAKFRRAFLDLVVFPCRERYSQIRQYTTTSIRKVSRMTSSNSPMSGTRKHLTTDTWLSIKDDRRGSNISNTSSCDSRSRLGSRVMYTNTKEAYRKYLRERDGRIPDEISPVLGPKIFISEPHESATVEDNMYSNNQYASTRNGMSNCPYISTSQSTSSL